MFKRLVNCLFGNRRHGTDTVVIKVRVNGNYSYYYPFKASAGMKVREMDADEFQLYLSAR